MRASSPGTRDSTFTSAVVAKPPLDLDNNSLAWCGVGGDKLPPVEKQPSFTEPFKDEGKALLDDIHL